jgi:hypothetical protein
MCLFGAFKGRPSLAYLNMNYLSVSAIVTSNCKMALLDRGLKCFIQIMVSVLYFGLPCLL